MFANDPLQTLTIPLFLWRVTPAGLKLPHARLYTTAEVVLDVIGRWAVQYSRSIIQTMADFFTSSLCKQARLCNTHHWKPEREIY
jgi:hypothetical protein